MRFRDAWGLFALIAVLMAPVATVAAAGGDAIELVYDCRLVNGKPVIEPTPGPRRRYDIIGNRDERPYHACRDGEGQDCRTMMVHSFKVRCGGKIVPWPEIARQIRYRRVGGSFIDNGKLNLVMAQDGRPKPLRFVLPAGYAPLGEVGARLVLGEDKIRRHPAGPPMPPEMAGADDVAGEAAEGDEAGAVGTVSVDVEDMPAAQAIPALLDNAGLFDTWKTVVHTAEASQAGVGLGASAGGQTGSFSQGVGGAFWYIGAGLAALMLLAFVFVQQRRMSGRETGGLFAAAAVLRGGGARDGITPVPVVASTLDRLGEALAGVGATLRARWLSLKWRSLRAGKPWDWHNVNIANGAKSAEALFEKADAAVRGLNTASVLRDTLIMELNSVRQRLDQLRSGGAEDGRTARLAASLRAVVRDLERIGRIAESASVSFKGDRDGVLIPKTRAQAFEVLGLNPDTPDATLKRIVDALRMGWHPDHARDEADRTQREERTKQINIAWDLIVGRRG